MSVPQRVLSLQKAVYNGHKRVHALKFQGVCAPDGIIIHISAPVEGRRHDSRLLRESGLEQILTDHAPGFYVYSDPAYGVTRNIQSPFKGAYLTPEQRQFNAAMSPVRVAVEWSFGGVLSNWAFLDYKKNLKVFLQPVGLYYLIGVLLQNIKACYYGNQIAEFFECHPPSVQEYLNV